MDLVSTIYTVVFQPYRLTAELLAEIHAVEHVSTRPQKLSQQHRCTAKLKEYFFCAFISETNTDVERTAIITA